MVIPAHDAALTLAEAITSALEQTRPPVEVVVVDDGSTDATAEIAASFGAAVVLRQLPGLGPSSARNAGVAASSAPLVAFLDADDSWHPRKLELQREVLDDPAVVLCATDWVRTVPLPDAADPLPRSTVGTGDLLALNRFQTSTVLVRRQALDDSGGFDSALDGAEDWDLWLRLSRLGGIVKLDAPLVRYRDHPGSYAKNLRRHHRAVLQMLERELPPPRQPAEAELLAWHHLRYAVAFLLVGDRTAAARCLRRLAADRALAAAVPAARRRLLPFLAERGRRRLERSR